MHQTFAAGKAISLKNRFYIVDLKRIIQDFECERFSFLSAFTFEGEVAPF